MRVGKRLITDHPHARGENFRLVLFHPLLSGPSPRTWGEPPMVMSEWATARTIPTHVGRTVLPASTVGIPSDHPHARGENSPADSHDVPTIGPSPRTWGEPKSFNSVAGGNRTIPTHVGRTLHVPPFSNRSADHPHARGENRGPVAIESQGYGPSPRTWGELCRRAHEDAPGRTIPTHVGRTAIQSHTS